jgi:diguanylate cyclase (GGDEF)-like protein
MNPDTTSDTPAIEESRDKLARLGLQVETMQAVLVRLLQDVVRAEAQLDRSQSEQLVAVNERLVVSAMQSQASAEAASQALATSANGAGLDPLTRLANRASFKGRALDVSANAKRDGGRFALLFIDLDNFKQINDTRGHAVGDRVLGEVARRMQATVRQADIVSRHGGDEFLVLLPDLALVRDAQAVAEKIAAAVAAPMDVEGTVIVISASVGIAIYPEDAEDFQALVARADAAMYHAKRLRLGTHAFQVSDTVTESGAPGEPARPAMPSPAPKPPAPGAEPDGATSASDVRQENLRLANEKLLLAALTARELQVAAEEARTRQIAFVAAVAEELRDPASPIRIASAMLGRQDGDEALLPRVQGLVDEQMTHMSRLLGNLVRTAGPPARPPPVVKRADLDLAAVVANAVAAGRPQIERRGQSIDVQAPAGPLPVSGDAASLLQLIANLLDNASKHTHDGGQISLVVAREAEKVTLSVSDNGIGIHPSMLSRVFDPFVQDIHALGFNGIGLGIGLTAALKLALAQGGQLTAHSEGLSRGSRFVLTLPLRR